MITCTCLSISRDPLCPWHGRPLPSDPDLRAALTSLIAQWRGIETSPDYEWEVGFKRAMMACAKDFESLLTPVAPTTEPEK